MEQREQPSGAARVTSDLSDAYCLGHARDLYGGHFGSREDRRRAVMRALRPVDEDVADALEAQQARLYPSAARVQNITALRRGAAVVVTGQQVGLFLGPLYTLYKAATAVRLARALSDEVNEPVVPVFWLQSEDHDLLEIAACHVRTAGTPLSLTLPVPANNRVSVAHCTLPDEVQHCLEALRRELGNLPHADEHLSRLARHYRPDAGWVQAFAGCLAELFADDGLLLLDPRDPGLARASIPVHRRALLDAQLIARALLERVGMVEAHGWRAPIHVRESAPLSFFHPEGPSGPRYRLSAAPGGFAEIGGERVHELEALLGWLERDPQCFSTSALLRPILQDSLLPTAAYVGGPAEVAYFAQLPPLYEAYGLAAPLVVPRARFRLLEHRTEGLLARTGLTPSDVSRPDAELLSRMLPSSPTHWPPEVFERHLLEGFEVALHEALAKAHMGEGTQFSPVDSMRSEVKKSAAKLRQRYEKTLRHRNGALLQELEQLKWLLYPGGEPQERFYGLAYFAARYGERGFVERVLQSVTPFDANPRDLRL
jgi:bacillithiol synthase